jgi:hypothetical protein
MKRVLLCVILIGEFYYSHAVVKTWNGGAAGNWNTAGNWLPTGVPGPSDDVIFNSLAVVNMNIITTPTPYIINSLKITNNANVELQLTQATGGVRILQVKSTSTVTKGLQIDAGSVLLMHGINTNTIGTLDYILDFAGAIGVTGEILGELDFSGVGSGGTADNTRLRVYTDVANNASLAVKSGGLIKYLDLTGNTASAAGAYLTMENGSVYEIAKNGGSFPDATWQPTSLARASNIFGANGPIFNGNTYGNLEWNCQSQTVAAFLNNNVSFNNVNFITTNGSAFRVKTGASAGNYTMTINGNLDIDNGAFIDVVGSGSPAGSSGKILLKGDLNIHSGGFLTSNGGAGTSNQLELNGSSNQNITVNGFWQGIRFEFIMNGVTATLLTPVTLPGNNNAAAANLQLINGRIITTTAHTLNMIRNSSVSGGSATSFVQGPMKKGGDNASFTFPLGIGSIYTPVTINTTGVLAASDTVVAEYIRSNPQGAFGNTYDPAGNPEVINHISFVEYYRIQKTSGVFTSGTITLPVTQYSFCKVFATTFVSRYDIGNSWWTNCGTSARVPGAPIGLYQTGNITSAAISTLGFFTLGTSDIYGVNPLPINLITFDAIKLNTSSSSLTWELAACCSADAKFEIQRAGTNRNFSTIGSVRGSAINTLYTYTDNGLKAGINYYRLKMIDETGTVTYSRTAAIMNGIDGLLLTSLSPTIVTSTTVLSVTSSKEQKIDMLIIDMQGRVVQRQSLLVAAGNSHVSIDAGSLAAGAYQLVGILNGSKTNVLRFVRR